MTTASTPRIIISGGGTGGHIFPAIAIADALRTLVPGIEILFVGAQGRMEMQRVPQAGYPIEGLWISGFQRRLSWQNLLFPLKVVHSLWRARQIIQRFRPQVAVGVGGYASGPLLEMATRLGVPALIQEQNSYAGVTNKILGGRVQKICVAYEGMEAYFPAEKLLLTGNPVRQNLEASTDPLAARQALGLDPTRLTLVVVGGSLGAKAINDALASSASWLMAHPNLQLFWQCGAAHYEDYRHGEVAALPNVKLVPFIERMELAYAAATVVASRAGALTISELCLVGKPAILLPSPFVAEDHQTKNAQALVNAGAALMLPNDQANHLLDHAFGLMQNAGLQQKMADNLRQLARPNAALDIAQAVLNLLK